MSSPLDRVVIKRAALLETLEFVGDLTRQLTRRLDELGGLPQRDVRSPALPRLRVPRRLEAVRQATTALPPLMPGQQNNMSVEDDLGPRIKQLTGELVEMRDRHATLAASSTTPAISRASKLERKIRYKQVALNKLMNRQRAREVARIDAKLSTLKMHSDPDSEAEVADLTAQRLSLRSLPQIHAMKHVG